MGATVVRDAVAELRATAHKLDADLKRAEGKVGRWGTRMGRKLGRRVRSGLNRISGVAGIGAAIGFGAVIGEARQFDSQMQRIGSQARLSAKETDAFASSITKSSKSTGLARDKLAGALDEMVNLEGGTALTTQNLETLGQAMLGTGSDGREMAQVMFTLGRNMDIAQDAMQGVLGGIDRIGAEASIPFSQLASSYVEVAAAASAFGDKGPDAVFSTVAAMQAMRREIPTADEIKTSFTNLATELIKKRKILQRKFKIRVVDPKTGDAKSLLKTLDELNKARQRSGRRRLSDAAIADIFGKRAAKGLRALLNNYEDYQALVEKGRQGQMEDFLGIRALERAASRAGRLDSALNRIKLALAEPFKGENLEALVTVTEGLAKAAAMAVRGYGEIAKLLDPDSRNRKLIDDTDAWTVTKGVYAGTIGAAGDKVDEWLGTGRTPTFAPGDLMPWERPHIKKQLDDLRFGKGVGPIVEGRGGFNMEDEAARRGRAASPAMLSRAEQQALMKQATKEALQEVTVKTRSVDAKPMSHRTEVAR